MLLVDAEPTPAIPRLAHENDSPPPQTGGCSDRTIRQFLPVRRVGCDLSRETIVKKYEKPVLIQLGTMDLIKSNHTGPSSDGKKYAGFFK